MTWQQIVARRAERNLKRFPAGDRKRLEVALHKLADNPHTEGVRQLAPGSTSHRLRVGAYRILFEIEPRYRLMVILAIERRSDTTYR